MTYRHLKSYKSILNLQKSRLFFEKLPSHIKSKSIKIFGNAKIDSSLKSKISIVPKYFVVRQ